MIASIGEIRISWIGVCYQVAGLVFEAMRLVMTEVLLSNNGEKMDPLVSLYYYAPVCGAMNLVLVYFSELGSFHVTDFQRVGVAVLVLNALVAFFLNVASVFLVSLGQFIYDLLPNVAMRAIEPMTDLQLHADWEDQ